MTTYVPVEIDYSTFPESDGEPMAETTANATQMIDLQWALRQLFARQGRPGISVGGNQLMYYNPNNGWDHVSPDVYVILDRQGAPPPSWKTWIEGGKFPDIVFEISSASTMDTDVGSGRKQKPSLYRRLGVQEYYIYDPQGDLQPSLQAYGWDEGEWVARSMLPSGGIWSPLLRAELRALPLAESRDRAAGAWLRIIDPATGEPIPLADEQVLQEQHARMAAEDRALIEHEARMAEHEARIAEHEARIAAEDRARGEAKRAAQAEQRLAALLEILRAQGIDPAAS